MAERPIHQAYLLTGSPGVGKTAIIKRLVEQIGSEHCGGFYTEEVREYGTRTGFNLVTLEGKERLLAHVRLSSSVSIGRYNVDLRCLDMIGVTAVADALAHKRLVIIDELGPMEALSASFRQAVLEALTSTVPLIGTITLRSHPWLDTIKQHPRVQPVVLTASEREAVYQNMLSFAQTVLAQEG